MGFSTSDFMQMDNDGNDPEECERESGSVETRLEPDRIRPDWPGMRHRYNHTVRTSHDRNMHSSVLYIVLVYAQDIQQAIKPSSHQAGEHKQQATYRTEHVRPVLVHLLEEHQQACTAEVTQANFRCPSNKF